MSYALIHKYYSSGDNIRFARKPQVINCNEFLKSNVWGQQSRLFLSYLI